MKKQPSMTLINQRGQLVEFYVPDNELYSITAVINGKKYDTGMYDLWDFGEGRDYNPIMLDDGTIVPAYETDY